MDDDLPAKSDYVQHYEADVIHEHGRQALEDMCLCGLLSLSLSVLLICCIEVFFAMVLLIQSPDLLTMDGKYFYFLGLFDGGGIIFFAIHTIMCASCVLTALLLYIGTKIESSLLLLPHLIWQCVFIALSLAISFALLILGFNGKMLMPSSVVLSAMLSVSAICEVWWSYLTLCYYRHLKAKGTFKLTDELDSGVSPSYEI
ncbi:hypothetical protein GCK32_012811 [Trichostrongylus colubriformis]|uniref:Transmembrane protein n=1 Tax=Trichostrongylus colubriformis TaxID=6319 RepID=A0AAN8FGH2_TRICO